MKMFVKTHTMAAGTDPKGLPAGGRDQNILFTPGKERNPGIKAEYTIQVFGRRNSNRELSFPPKQGKSKHENELQCIIRCRIQPFSGLICP
jgi:hypothetical protein